MIPPSSYLCPSHSPLKVIGPPTFQSDAKWVPKKYCSTIAGSVRPFHTSAIGALNSMVVFNVSVLIFSVLVVVNVVVVGKIIIFASYLSDFTDFPDFRTSPNQPLLNKLV